MNESRNNFDEKPLKELPKQDKSLFDYVPQLKE